MDHPKDFVPRSNKFCDLRRSTGLFGLHQTSRNRKNNFDEMFDNDGFSCKATHTATQRLKDWATLSPNLNIIENVCSQEKSVRMETSTRQKMDLLNPLSTLLNVP